MKRPRTDAPRLRAQLTSLVLMGRPTPRRASEIRRLVARIAAQTASRPRAVVERACRDAVEQLLGGDAR